MKNVKNECNSVFSSDAFSERSDYYNSSKPKKFSGHRPYNKNNYERNNNNYRGNEFKLDSRRDYFFPIYNQAEVNKWMEQIEKCPM